ncbi:MAG: hypothetical protein Q8R79_01515 [Legionellaceae bacterium]|nr:hypothetical protein [Legionellaceae bacterium]
MPAPERGSEEYKALEDLWRSFDVYVQNRSMSSSAQPPEDYARQFNRPMTEQAKNELERRLKVLKKQISIQAQAKAALEIIKKISEVIFGNKEPVIQTEQRRKKVRRVAPQEKVSPPPQQQEAPPPISPSPAPKRSAEEIQAAREKDLADRRQQATDARGKADASIETAIQAYNLAIQSPTLLKLNDAKRLLHQATAAVFKAGDAGERISSENIAPLDWRNTQVNLLDKNIEKIKSTSVQEVQTAAAQERQKVVPPVRKKLLTKEDAEKTVREATLAYQQYKKSPTGDITSVESQLQKALEDVREVLDNNSRLKLYVKKGEAQPSEFKTWAAVAAKSMESLNNMLIALTSPQNQVLPKSAVPEKKNVKFSDKVELVQTDEAFDEAFDLADVPLNKATVQVEPPEVHSAASPPAPVDPRVANAQKLKSDADNAIDRAAQAHIKAKQTYTPDDIGLAKKMLAAAIGAAQQAFGATTGLQGEGIATVAWRDEILTSYPEKIAELQSFTPEARYEKAKASYEDAFNFAVAVKQEEVLAYQKALKFPTAENIASAQEKDTAVTSAIANAKKSLNGPPKLDRPAELDSLIAEHDGGHLDRMSALFMLKEKLPINQQVRDKSQDNSEKFTIDQEEEQIQESIESRILGLKGQLQEVKRSIGFMDRFSKKEDIQNKFLTKDLLTIQIKLLQYQARLDKRDTTLSERCQSSENSTPLAKYRVVKELLKIVSGSEKKMLPDKIAILTKAQDVIATADKKMVLRRQDHTEHSSWTKFRKWLNDVFTSSHSETMVLKPLEDVTNKYRNKIQEHRDKQKAEEKVVAPQSGGGSHSI